MAQRLSVRKAVQPGNPEASTRACHPTDSAVSEPRRTQHPAVRDLPLGKLVGNRSPADLVNHGPLRFDPVGEPTPHVVSEPTVIGAPPKKRPSRRI